mgnify:CR=1 FL=1
MKREHAMKLVDQGIATLNAALQAGHSEALERFLATLARFHHYSFGNALLIAFQKSEATHVAGFHTWKKLGRFVKKGEQGIAITGIAGNAFHQPYRPPSCRRCAPVQARWPATASA